MRHCESLVDRDGMRDPVSGVQHHAGRSARCVQTKDDAYVITLGGGAKIAF